MAKSPLNYMTFDLGQNLGMARARGRAEPTWSLEKLPACGEDYGAMAQAFRGVVHHQFKNVLRPAVVAIATPWVAGKDRIHSDRILLGLAWQLEDMCRNDFGIPLMDDHEQTMRRYFLAPYDLPKGSEEINKAVVARCAALGWKTQTDHEAAALCVMEFLRSEEFRQEGWPSPAERSGLFRHADDDEG